MRRKRTKRSRHAGMTLIEIMVVIVIMTMIATAVGVAVFNQLKKSKLSQAKTDTKTIQTAVELYLVGGGEGCPTIDDLLESGDLKKGTTTVDPWGQAFAISCEGEDITVTSSGPDREFGNDDDI